MHFSIRFWLPFSLVALAGPVLAEDPASAIDLFNGKDLTGWSLVTHPASDIAKICHVTADGTLAVAGKPVGYLLADGTYKNYTLHVEWRWPAQASSKSNSGFLVDIASGPIDRDTWPLCFQVQTNLGRAGDLLPMAGASFVEKLSVTAPDAKTPQLDRKNWVPSEKTPRGMECLRYRLQGRRDPVHGQRRPSE